MTDKTFEISGTNFEFSPNKIEVNEGDRIKIVFKSEQGYHDWVCDEFDARTDRVSTGNTADTEEFDADQVGEFNYYCSYSNHRQNGMEGTIIVKENEKKHAELLKAARDVMVSITTDRNSEGKYVFRMDVSNNPDIKVPQGALVKLTLTSAGGTHDWVVDELENARTRRVRSGESDTAEFLVTRAGDFPYYCSVGSHRRTMKGRFIVEASG